MTVLSARPNYDNFFISSPPSFNLFHFVVFTKTKCRKKDGQKVRQKKIKGKKKGKKKEQKKESRKEIKVKRKEKKKE